MANKEVNKCLCFNFCFLTWWFCKFENISWYMYFCSSFTEMFGWTIAQVNQMKDLEEKKKTIQARLDGKLPLFDETEQGKMLDKDYL